MIVCIIASHITAAPVAFSYKWYSLMVVFSYKKYLKMYSDVQMMEIIT